LFLLIGHGFPSSSELLSNLPEGLSGALVLIEIILLLELDTLFCDEEEVGRDRVLRGQGILLPSLLGASKCTLDLGLESQDLSF